jgi:hypothetical protein
LEEGQKVLKIDGVRTATLTHKQLTATLSDAAKEQRSVLLLVEVDDDSLSNYALGDHVEARNRDGIWLPATITAIKWSGPVAKRRIDVVFDEASHGGGGCSPDNVRPNDSALPAFWVPAYVAGGEKYYYSTVTGETSWEFPKAVRCAVVLVFCGLCLR